VAGAAGRGDLVTIANARPTMISQSILDHLERDGVFVSWRQKQIITALFDPKVGPDLVDHLVGPQPWIKYAICDVCGKDVHITRAGTVRKHKGPTNVVGDFPRKCDGSGTTCWHL